MPREGPWPLVTLALTLVHFSDSLSQLQIRANGKESQDASSACPFAFLYFKFSRLDYATAKSLSEGSQAESLIKTGAAVPGITVTAVETATGVRSQTYCTGKRILLFR